MQGEITRIESGPTKERIVRSSLMFTLFAVGAVWFAYDGWKGYPDKNFREHIESLPPEDREKAKESAVYPEVSEETLRSAQEAVRKIGLDNQRNALEDLYGGPPSYENDQTLYYYGPYFRVEFPIKNGSLGELVPQATEKRQLDIAVQQWLAVGLAVFSLFVLIHVLRVIFTQLTLDENGLSYRGKGSISWKDMTALEADRFREKGWVDLVFSDNGRERRLRLDEYHLKAFNDVIAAICTQKGFEDPVELEKAEKAAKQQQT